jgi:hypothetical protein
MYYSIRKRVEEDQVIIVTEEEIKRFCEENNITQEELFEEDVDLNEGYYWLNEFMLESDAEVVRDEVDIIEFEVST